MRLSLVGLVATLATMVAFVLGQDPAPAAELAPGASAARPGVPILFHLKFHLRYEIDWSHKSGLEGAAQDPCASWQKDRGSTTIIASDAPWRRKSEKKARRHGIPGSYSFLGKGKMPKWAQGMWASGTAIGSAEVDVHRRWIQKGGPTAGDITAACPDRRSAITPWLPTKDDCGSQKFTTKTARFDPQRRKDQGKRAETLHDLMTIPGATTADDNTVFSITIAPARDLYRSCMTYDPAPFPLNLGVQIKYDDFVDLKNVPPGGQVKGDWLQRGACDEDIPKAECMFTIDLEWTIDRVPKGRIVFP